MFRVQKQSDEGNSVTFSLSGRIESQHVDELRRMLETEHRRVSLDLEEVKLVDSDAVSFLSSLRCARNRTQELPSVRPPMDSGSAVQQG